MYRCIAVILLFLLTATLSGGPAGADVAIVNSAPLTYQDLGSGPPIVLMIRADTTDLEPLLDSLTSSHRVVLIEPGTGGGSDRASGTRTFSHLDALSLMDLLGIDSAVVIAHRNAGIVALCLAAGFPSRVSQLILLSAGLPSNAESHQVSIPAAALSSVRAATLIVVGDQDVVSPMQSLEMFHRIPNARLCVIPVYPRASLLDHPATLAKVIRSHLE